MITELAHWLVNTGDLLYGWALALTPDERTARRLLQRWLQSVRSDPPAVWRDDDLLARLYQVAGASFADQPLRRLPAPPGAPLLGPLRALPLDQRVAVLAYSLPGVDQGRLAAILGIPSDSAMTTLVQAMQALAPALGHTLPSEESSRECSLIRQALIDPTQHLRIFETIRRHLTACTPCRQFEREWQTVSRALMSAIRHYRNTTALPDSVRTQLLKTAQAPKHRLARLSPLLPLAVLISIVTVLVLPGLIRNPFTVVTTSAAEPALSAAALIERAMAHGGIPEPEGPPVWQARYQTLWYFNNRTIAPLFAEIWHDRDNPARHRLQLRHVEGGAPYEFQLGDGSRRFYYALDGAYAPTLYGDLPVRANPNEPELVMSILTSEQQEAAYRARRTTGPWAIVPTYLRQASTAPDLRLLGQQRIGERLASIVSFRGISPLDLPAESADSVLVLMAISEQDGHVLSITELVGPPGGTQTSRVVWRLVAFNWLVTGEQIRDAFTFERAWNGRAETEGLAIQPIADPAWPLVRENNVIDIGTTNLQRLPGSFVLPAAMPAGIDRELLVRFRGSTINGVLYTGDGRRLILTYDRLPGLDTTIPVEVIGPWRVRIEPVRGQRYRVAIETNNSRRNAGVRLALDASGFTIDELRTLIGSLQRIDRLDVITRQSRSGQSR